MTITEDRQKTIRDMTVLQIWQAVEPLLAVAMKAYQFGPSSYTYEALQACMDFATSCTRPSWESLKAFMRRRTRDLMIISPKLFLFIERVVAAEMDIVVQRGIVCLGASGGSRATSKIANDLCAQLTDDLKAEIVEVFVEGDFECRELAAFLSTEPPDTVVRLWPEWVRIKG